MQRMIIRDFIYYTTSHYASLQMTLRTGIRLEVFYCTGQAMTSVEVQSTLERIKL